MIPALTLHAFCPETPILQPTELEGEMCPSPERSEANRQHELNSQENQGKPLQCMNALRHPLSMQNRHQFHAWDLPIPLSRTSLSNNNSSLLLRRSRAPPALRRFELLVPQSLPVSNLTLRLAVTPQTYLISHFFSF